MGRGRKWGSWLGELMMKQRGTGVVLWQTSCSLIQPILMKHTFVSQTDAGACAWLGLGAEVRCSLDCGGADGRLGVMSWSDVCPVQGSRGAEGGSLQEGSPTPESSVLWASLQWGARGGEAKTWAMVRWEHSLHQDWGLSGFSPETMKAQGGCSKDGQVGRGELQGHWELWALWRCLA